MRIVHNGRYIEIPNTNNAMISLSMTDCIRLLTYIVNPNLYMRFATDADHYYLVQDMIRNDCYDSKFIANLSDCLLPNLTNVKKVFIRKLILPCLKRGIKFYSGNQIFCFDTIRELDLSGLQLYDLTDADIRLFTALRKLVIESNPGISLGFIRDHRLATTLEELRVNSCFKIEDSSLQHFQCLQKLTLINVSDVKFDFITATHPLAYSLIELNLSASMKISDSTLQHFHRLEKLSSKFNKELTLAFLGSDPSHPLNYTLTNFDCRFSGIQDFGLKNLQNLRSLNVSHCKLSLGFITSEHPMTKSLTTLDAESTDISDVAIRHMRELRELSAKYNEKITLRFLTDETNSRQHPLCDSLLTLNICNSGVRDDALAKLNCLRKLETNNKVTLEFLVPDSTSHDPFIHPIAESLIELRANYSKIGDKALQHLRVLQILEASSNMTLEFLRPDNGVIHPLADSLIDLDITNSGINDIGLSYLRRLAKLIARKDNITLDFITPDHPLTGTLLDIITIHSSISDRGLMNLRVLTNLDANEKITLSFITSNHPLTRTLTHLKLGTERVNDDTLQHFRILQSIYAWEKDDIKLGFLNSTHPLTYTIEYGLDKSCISKETMSMLKNFS